MKIKEVRERYSAYKISYIPKRDYLIGITDSVYKVRRKDKYEEIFISSLKNQYWILYPTQNFMTGSFKSKKEAVDWFKMGGR